MPKRLQFLRILPLACLFLLQLVQASPAFAGLNLCIGEEGHVEVEVQESPCCPSQTGFPLEATFAVESDDCTSCIDVGLAHQDPQPPALQENASGKVLPSLSRWLGVRASGSPSLSASALTGPSDAPALQALRTVVLRV